MAKLTEIRWHGRGGQGVVTAGKLLAETAMGAGQYFQAFPDYGPERMGAPIRAFTRLSSEPITIHSQIRSPTLYWCSTLRYWEPCPWQMDWMRMGPCWSTPR
jgi:pyruvate ferredoxin oxidoreductase gamma subunit